MKDERGKGMILRKRERERERGGRERESNKEICGGIDEDTFGMVIL